MHTDQADASAGCDETRLWVQGYVSNASDAARDSSARAHMAVCEACQAEYRTAVLTTARIGRQRREERSDKERGARHQRLRRAAFDGQLARPGRFHRLRTLLYPAFFCVLLLHVASLRVEGPLIECEVLAGEVALGEAVLHSAHGTLAIEQGEWCDTAPDGRARLSADGLRIEVGSDSRLRLQRARPLALYVARGELTVEGSCELTCAQAVFDVSNARMILRVEAAGAHVDVLAGSVTHTDAAGTRSLLAGQSFSTATRTLARK